MEGRKVILSKVVFIFIITAMFVSFQYVNGQERSKAKKNWSSKDIQAKIGIEPGLNQLQYSPAEGSTVKLNPPLQ